MFIKFLKEVLFPLFCVICDEEGKLVCDVCLESVKKQVVFSCPSCHTINADGTCCEDCKDKSFISKIFSPFSYTDPVISRLVHALKYEYIEEAAHYIKVLIEPFVEQHKDALSSYDAIVSVPLHRRRYAERGFNQADVVARILSEFIGRPIIAPLSRKKYTRQQMLLSKEQRLKNVSDVFVSDLRLSYRSILLVDDVYTTGATMQACAAAIKEANPDIFVSGFTIARG